MFLFSHVFQTKTTVLLGCFWDL